MDRRIPHPNQILDDVELLKMQRNSLIGLGWLTQAVLGTNTSISGLPCAPTSPASMSVQVGTVAIHSLQSLDASAYGSLASDTTTPHQLVKQGLNLAVQTLSCPAPTTSGQSIVYLIEAAYQDYDTDSTVLQYFNPANPSVAFTGPNNTGGAQNTTRQGLCTIQAKAGVAATTGAQTVPAVDSGYVALYTVTVPYGATTITSANIATVAGAPFITLTLPALDAAVAALQNTNTVPNVSVFTMNGTFTVPAGCTAVDVEVQAGGGGSGAGYSGNYGGGGGGGGYQRGRFAVTPGAVISVTVGGGGGGGSYAATDGAAGGGSSFGSFISATAGSGGQSATSLGSAVTVPATGGGGSGGYFGVYGGTGGLGNASYLGFGGSSFFAPPNGPYTNGTAVNGSNYGQGAAGTSGVNNGASGASGIVIVRHLP